MSEQHAEYLRRPETMCDADVRNEGRIKLDEAGMHPFTIEDHHGRVSGLVLNPAVPEDIVIQFETTKNIYLYAWCVYRFYPVARQHALSVLELALRERLDSEIPMDSSYRHGKDKHLYLSSMLKYCRDCGILKDEHFEVARHLAVMRSRQRVCFEMIERMDREGLDEISWDEEDVEVLDVDRDFDHVGRLVKSLPGQRNAHAHGSKMLDNHAYGTLSTVSEIINQLWM